MQTPLHVAATWGHAEIARLLLARPGIDVNAFDSRGSTPLHEAVSMGHGETVELLLSCSEIDINRRDANGNTPLHCAACGKQAGVARILLSRPGILVNARNKRGCTPLHLAVESWVFDGDVMELLLNAPGVDIHAVDDAVDDAGDTVLSSAASRGPHRVKRLLRSWNAKESAQWHHSATKALQKAARFSQVEVVEMLLTDDHLGIDLAADVGKSSALYAAAAGNSDKVARILLDTAKIPVSEEERVLYLAAAKGSAAVVQLFIERGTGLLDITNDIGRTPLEVARE
ncbi:Ankyrin repeat-containing domain protein [Rhypophila decipiens]